MSHKAITTMFGLVAALCLLANGHANAETSPPTGWFGNVYLGGQSAFDARKSLIVTYRFNDAGVQVADVAVAYGTVSRLPDAGHEYVLELIGSGGKVLSKRTASDPRAVIVEKEGNARLEEGLLTARFAFEPAGQKVRLSDASGRTLAEADLASAITSFCRIHSRDSDCISMARSKRISP